MHLLSAAAHCPDLVDLIDHPATFGHVWPVLGWNIHTYPDTGGDHVWGHDPAATPLYSLLKEQGFLDPANPPRRP
jgi:hypothetical protein